MNLENIIGTGLVIGMLVAIYYGMNELSMSIASGLIGYIGRGKVNEFAKENKEDK